MHVYAAAQVLASGHSVNFHSGAVLPLTGVDLTLDPLGALFIATTAVVGLAAICYSVGYAEHALRSRTAIAMFLLFLDEPPPRSRHFERRDLPGRLGADGTHLDALAARRASR